MIYNSKRFNKAECEFKNYFMVRNDNLGKASFNILKLKYSISKNSLIYHQLDINSQNSINSIINWIKFQFGKIDILFNNAGIYLFKCKRRNY